MTHTPPKYPPSTDVGAYRPPKPNRLWQAILSFIDWLNRLAGVEKPKRKRKQERIFYGSVPKWFEIEIRSRPRHERESFYHPPPEVIHTPYEWIDGKESGRKHGAWKPIEQMATFGELFEDENIPDDEIWMVAADGSG